MRIMLTGGGSGGHLFPLIAIAREIKKNSLTNPILQGNPLEFIFMGPQTIGQEILQQENIEIKFIFSGKLRRYASIRIFLDFLGLFLGIFQALWNVFIFMPDVIFSKGGYGSLPVVFAGWLYRIPILIHESDSLPGLTNIISSHLAKKISVSFSEALNSFPAKKTALLGNPIREELLSGTKEEAIKIFNLTGDKPVLLIIGGSQGAQMINNFIVSVLPALTIKYEIIHQCGENNYQDIKKQIEGLKDYHFFAFLNETQIKNAYAVADLIISRAGANSIFEIAANGKASIIIPLPGSARDHQRANAYNYAKSGAAIVLEQPNLTPHLFATRIAQLIENKELLQKMGESAKNFYRFDAGQKIAEEIIKLSHT